MNLKKLGDWIASVRYDDVPEPSLKAARFQMINMLAAAYASASLPETHAVLAGLKAMNKTGKCTVFATGDMLPPVEAAMVNAAYSMAQDFDDIIWMGHTCHSSVFASLAIAEHEDATTKELLTAIVVANEISGRIGATSFLGPLNGQMCTYIHLVAAAAAGAKLLKLNGEQSANALAISLSQPNFALQPGFMLPTSKLLSASTPTATGMQAAYLACEGVTGDLSILEDKRGFWKRFSFLPMPYMLGELGEFWAIQTLTVKTFPGCHFFQTACTALERILKKRSDVSFDNVARVELETTKFGYEVTHFAADYANTEGPLSAVNLNFDLATTAAVFLHAGQLTSAEADSEWLSKNTDAVKKWKTKITVKHDLSLTEIVLFSAKALPTGNKALSALGMGDLIYLARSYAREYSSSLLSGTNPAQWGKALFRFLKASAKKTFSEKEASSSDATISTSAVPLRFPNRATIYFSDGQKFTEQVDLPVGAFCSPQMETELKNKFITGAGKSFGQDKAHSFYDQLLKLDTENLKLGDQILQKPGTTPITRA